MSDKKITEITRQEHDAALLAGYFAVTRSVGRRGELSPEDGVAAEVFLETIARAMTLSLIMERMAQIRHHVLLERAAGGSPEQRRGEPAIPAPDDEPPPAAPALRSA